MKNEERKNKRKNGKEGITLIALVITIIVLLVLAGVSISILTGDNGILTKASNSKVASEQANILEQLRLEIYEMRLNIENKTNEIDWLKTKGIIQQEIQGEQNVAKLASIRSEVLIAKTYIDKGDNIKYILNVNKITQNPSTGNGTWNTGDIYYILQGDLYYKSKDGENHLLGKIYTEQETKNLKWIYEENQDGNIEITGIDFTDFNCETYDNYNVSILLGIENLKVPTYIEEKKVVKINLTTILANQKPYRDYYIMGVKKIILGDTVEEFAISNEIRFYDTETIQLPNSLVKMEVNLKFYNQKDVTINFEQGKNPALQIPEEKWGASKIIIQGIEQ